MLTRIHLESRDYKESTIFSQADIVIEKKEYRGPIFEIAETDNIYLTFESAGLQKIYVENTNGEDYLEVKNNIEFHLTDGQENAYFPGYFSISIVEGEKEYCFLFFVRPKQLDYANVIYLRNYVNEFYNGLSYDLLKQSRRDSIAINESQESKSLIEKYTYILNNFPSLINSVVTYIRNCPVDTVKRESVKRIIKSVDAKAIKWLSTKGSLHNENMFNPNALLVRKTTYNLNTYENQSFKSQLIFWSKELKEIISQINECTTELDKSIDEYNAKITTINNSLELVKGQKKIAKSVKDGYEFQIKDLKRDIANIQQYKSIFDSKNQLKKYLNVLERCLNDTWLSTVDPVPITKSPKSFKLQTILQFRNEYIGIKRRSKRKNSDTTELSFAEKSSPKLFETFNYVMLLKILNEKGFTISDGISNQLIYTLSNPSVMTLTKDNVICEIRYDQVISEQKDLTQNDFCLINSTHNRPDFLVTFRKDDDIKPFYSIVFEIKWRAYDYVYNKDGDTDVVKTLKDYWSLAYYTIKNRKIRRGAIDNVVVIYPDYHERSIDIMAGTIIGIGVLPNENIKNSIGYNSISNLIDEYLANE